MHAETQNALAAYLPEHLGASPVDEQRRHLLMLAASSLGLAAAAPLLAASAATPSVLETAATTAAALDRAESALYAAAVGHMRPDTDPDAMQAVAAGVLRDMQALRGGTGFEQLGRLLCVESMAAAMVGSIYGHARAWNAARPWFAAAKDLADHAHTLGEVRAPAAAMLADSLMSKVVLYTHPDQAKGALAMAAAAAATAAHPRLGHATPGSALPLSLLARAHAMRGNTNAAVSALGETARLLDSPGYFAAPFWLEDVDGVDGPMSLFGYGARAHRFVEAEVYAYTGDVRAATEAAEAYLSDAPADAPPSTTSATLARLLTPRAHITAGAVETGCELAHGIVAGLPDHKRNPAIMTRAAELADLARQQLGGAMPTTGPVAAYSTYVRRQCEPALADV